MVQDMNSAPLEKIRDVCRFIIAFHHPVVTSAPHTYISTGPFVPSESPLSTIFGVGFAKAMKWRTGRLLSWPEPPSIWSGHTGAVTCTSYSPDGHHIVTGS